jgi:hypothetical protein
VNYLPLVPILIIAVLVCCVCCSTATEALIRHLEKGGILKDAKGQEELRRKGEGLEGVEGRENAEEEERVISI